MKLRSIGGVLAAVGILVGCSSTEVAKLITTNAADIDANVIGKITVTGPKANPVFTVNDAAIPGGTTAFAG